MSYNVVLKEVTGCTWPKGEQRSNIQGDVTTILELMIPDHLSIQEAKCINFFFKLK